jgi:hypothetical protein
MDITNTIDTGSVTQWGEIVDAIRCDEEHRRAKHCFRMLLIRAVHPHRPLTPFLSLPSGREFWIGYASAVMRAAVFGRVEVTLYTWVGFMACGCACTWISGDHADEQLAAEHLAEGEARGVRFELVPRSDLEGKEPLGCLCGVPGATQRERYEFKYADEIAAHREKEARRERERQLAQGVQPGRLVFGVHDADGRAR